MKQAKDKNLLDISSQNNHKQDISDPHNGDDRKSSNKDENKEQSTKQEKSFDDILNQLGFGKYQLLVFLLVGAAGITDGCQQICFSISIPLLRTYLNTNKEIESLTGSAFFVGILLGSLISGPISDNLGRRRPYVISSLFLCIIRLWYSYISTMTEIIVLGCISGFLIGIIIPTSFTILAECLPSHSRGRWLSFIGINYVGGQLLGCLFAFFALSDLNTGNWRYLLFLTFIPTMICFISVFFFLDESPRFNILKGKYDDAIVTINKMAKFNKNIKDYINPQNKNLIIGYWNTLNVKSQNQMQASKAQQNISIIQLVKNLFQGKYKIITPILWFIWFTNNLVYFGIQFLLPQTLLAMQNQQGEASIQSSETQNNLQQSKQGIINLGISTLSELPTIFVASIIVEVKNLGTKRSLGLSFLIGGASCVLIFLQCPPSFLMWVSIVKFLFLLTFTLTYNYTAEIYPTQIRTSGIGIASSVSRLGSISMSWISMYLMQKQMFFPYLLFGVVALAAGFLTFCIKYDTTDQSLDKIEKTE